MGSLGSPPMGSYQLPIDTHTYGLSLVVIQLAKKHFRLSDPDTMTNTDLEAIALSSGNDEGK